MYNYIKLILKVCENRKIKDNPRNIQVPTLVNSQLKEPHIRLQFKKTSVSPGKALDIPKAIPSKKEITNQVKKEKDLDNINSGEWDFVLSNKATKNLEKMDTTTKIKLKVAMKLLSFDEFHPNIDQQTMVIPQFTHGQKFQLDHNGKKLEFSGEYKMREGNYRIVFSKDKKNKTYFVHNIDHRKMVYGKGRSN